MSRRRISIGFAHVALLGHITIEELRRELSDVKAANGFANRIHWFAVRRSKEIPEPEPFAGPAVEALAEEVASPHPDGPA